MALGLIGLKVGMTQIYNEAGKASAVTVLQVGPCPVLQIRNQETDEYDAVQVGFLEKERHKATRAERGHVAADLESKRRKAGHKPIIAKANCEPPRFIREFRLEKPAAGVTVGDLLIVDKVFTGVKSVDVIGTSKGRGFSGAMKRHNFQGLPAAHGAKKVHRSAGSIGSHASNRGFGRPKLGHKAAGQYGNAQRTVRNLKVLKIDAENHLLLVAGAVPGPNGGMILVRPTNKKQIRQAVVPVKAKKKLEIKKK